MCKGMEARNRSVNSRADLRGLRLGAGNLQRPRQLSRPETVAVAIWCGTEEPVPEMTRR